MILARMPCSIHPLLWGRSSASSPRIPSPACRDFSPNDSLTALTRTNIVFNFKCHCHPTEKNCLPTVVQQLGRPSELFSYDYRLLMQIIFSPRNKTVAFLVHSIMKEFRTWLPLFTNPGPKAKPIKSRHVVWRKNDSNILATPLGSWVLFHEQIQVLKSNLWNDKSDVLQNGTLTCLWLPNKICGLQPHLATSSTDSTPSMNA